ncbi:hypothetical protein [Methylobacter marinus]|uniref:hypothetical protein n=1 Tax=Methylobacter marinus TaxID=34058 RepID=UPI000374A1B8|nr:hypothetical protein [Methylobacter marinus]
MATYVNAADIDDPSFVITEEHCKGADVFVNLSLRERGFNPADITLPNAVLTEIATYWAKRLAAIEGAIGDDSPLIAKAREFEKDAKTLVGKLTREALGITVPTGTAFGQITLGRG